jgi:hypothetical protein
VPIDEPMPQPPAYHFHDAPVPNDPPDTLILVLPPKQIEGDTALALVGFAEATQQLVTEIICDCATLV